MVVVEVRVADDTSCAQDVGNNDSDDTTRRTISAAALWLPYDVLATPPLRHHVAILPSTFNPVQPEPSQGKQSYAAVVPYKPYHLV
eukprot:scaffold7320_cov137-Skeletonema_marinoi.AAC.2